MRSIYISIVIMGAMLCGPAHAVDMSPQSLLAIQAEIQKWGSAPVMVEFTSPSVSSNSLAEVNGETRRLMIDSMRAGFLATLSNNVAATVRQNFSYVPGLLSAVNAEQLVELQQNPYVKNIFQNKIRKATLAESVDLAFPSQSASRFDGGGWVVAVLDTGVDKTHSFLTANGSSKIVSEACYSGGGYANYKEVDSLCPGNVVRSTANGSGVHCTGYSGCDHGTHVGGIAAGNGGLALGANVLAVQVFTGFRDVFNRNLCGTGVGDNCIVAFDSDILAGLERVYALRNTLQLAAVNMSLGGGNFGGSCNGENTLVTNIVSQLKSANIATVVASGNNGFSSSLAWPACISNAIAVGATSDFTGTISGYAVTKDRRVFYSNNGTLLDLYAPGTLIRSSVPGNSFANFNGTSMAAPHVAGAFAVLKQGKPEATVTELEGVLKSVGPSVSSNGISRQRLSVTDALRALGLGSINMAPINYLLLEDSPPPP